MHQLNLFEFELEEQSNNLYKELKKKLSRYSIDKIYDKEFKGQGAILNVIENRLKKQEDYNEYIRDLIEELKKIVPFVDYNYKFDKNQIFKYDNDNYGYQVITPTKNTISEQGPIYCIDMIPKEIF